MSFEVEEGKNGKVVVRIEFDPNEGRLSKSGKSMVLDTSNGFTWQNVKGTQIGVNYNIIKKEV